MVGVASENRDGEHARACCVCRARGTDRRSTGDVRTVTVANVVGNEDRALEGCSRSVGVARAGLAHSDRRSWRRIGECCRCGPTGGATGRGDVIVRDEVVRQGEGVFDGTVRADLHLDVMHPCLAERVVHNDANAGVTQPSGARECYWRTGGIVQQVADDGDRIESNLGEAGGGSAIGINANSIHIETGDEGCWKREGGSDGAVNVGCRH